MNEHKRFELEYVRGKPNFWDNVVDLADCYLTCEDVVDLLNALHEENKIFRTFIELNDFDADEIIRQGRGFE